MTRQAEKLAAKITDPNKKKQLLEAIKEVKLCAQVSHDTTQQHNDSASRRSCRSSH